MTRGYKLFLNEIVESIEKILKFTKDMSFEEFRKDDKTASAVVRKLEIIEEASKNIPNQIEKSTKLSLGRKWRKPEINSFIATSW